MSFPPGVPIGFPPFLLPPSSMAEGMKESGPPVPSPFHFLPGFRPPPGAPGFPPGLLPPGLLDPSHAQALLTMMRGQMPNHPSFARQAAPPPLDLTAGESPAKKIKRDSSSTEDPPVSPPPSHPEPSRTSCQSLCAMSQSCSEEGRMVMNWSTEQVVEFVSSISQCHEYAQVGFTLTVPDHPTNHNPSGVLVREDRWRGAGSSDRHPPTVTWAEARACTQAEVSFGRQAGDLSSLQALQTLSHRYRD